MRRVLVGTYADRHGGGLVPLVRDGGHWRMEPALPHVRNASWAVAAPTAGLRYVVDEGAHMIAVCRGAGWEKMVELPAGGEAPCHLALSADERRLAVANYASGSVSVLDLDEHGLPVSRTSWQGKGRGPDPERQTGPHAHWIGFTEDGTLLRVDLGADRIVAGLGDAERTLFAAPPGSGPRHLVFHPHEPLAYLVSELASTLSVLRTDAQCWTIVSVFALLPPDAPTGSLGGGIAFDAERHRLFVTTRGEDSILTFAVAPDGMPRLLSRTASGGASPRFILPIGPHLLVAHEEEGGVSIFRLGDDGGPAGPPQRLPIRGAAFMMIDGR